MSQQPVFVVDAEDAQVRAEHLRWLLIVREQIVMTRDDNLRIDLLG
jgi:hypothetical protein